MRFSGTLVEFRYLSHMAGVIDWVLNRHWKRYQASRVTRALDFYLINAFDIL